MSMILFFKADADPCWDGYKMVGTKKKRGRKVPNCVPEGDGVGEGMRKAQIAGANTASFRLKISGGGTLETRSERSAQRRVGD